MEEVNERQARRRLLALAAAFVFIYLGAGAQQQYVVPYFTKTLGWSEIVAGLLVALVYIGETATRVVNLALVAGWADSLLSFIGSITYVLFPLAVGLAYFTHSFPLVLAAGLLWGWGGSCFWTGSSMQTLRYGDALRGSRHGLSTGILYLATHLGFFSGVVVLGIIHAHFRQAPYALFFVAAGFTAVGSLILSGIPRTGGAVAEPLTWRAVREVAGRVKVKVASFLMLMSGVAFGTMLGPFAAYVENEFGRDWLWITASFFPIARMAVALTAGIAADYVSAHVLMTAAFGFAAVGLAVVPHWESPWAMALAAFALGMLQGTIPVVATAMVGQSAERKRRALPHAIIFSFRDIGVTGAVMAALISHHKIGDFAPVFRAFAGVFAICGLVSLVLRRHADERL